MHRDESEIHLGQYSHSFASSGSPVHKPCALKVHVTGNMIRDSIKYRIVVASSNIEG